MDWTSYKWTCATGGDCRTEQSRAEQRQWMRTARAQSGAVRAIDADSLARCSPEMSTRHSTAQPVINRHGHAETTSQLTTIVLAAESPKHLQYATITALVDCDWCSPLLARTACVVICVVQVVIKLDGLSTFVNTYHQRQHLHSCCSFFSNN